MSEAAVITADDDFLVDFNEKVKSLRQTNTRLLGFLETPLIFESDRVVGLAGLQIRWSGSQGILVRQPGDPTRPTLLQQPGHPLLGPVAFRPRITPGVAFRESLNCQPKYT